MVRHPSCVFCQIIAGEATSSQVYQDELVTAFMDIQPLIQGHVLVIPNQHFNGLTDLDEKYGNHILRTARRVAQAMLRSRLGCEGVNLFLAEGTAAGQSVFHTHMHVIPRHAGDGFRVQHPSGYGERPPRSDLDKVADQLKEALMEGK